MDHTPTPISTNENASTRTAAWRVALHRGLLRTNWMAWLAFLFGIVGSIAASIAVHEQVKSDASREFSGNARDLAEQISDRLRAHSEVIYSIRALADTSENLSREEFRRFVGGLGIDRRYPGITNLSYSIRVPEGQRSEFESRMRAEGAVQLAGQPAFTIKPLESRADAIVLSYVEPLKGNSAALGLDLLSDPIRQRAVETARDSGSLSTTAALTLLRDTKTGATSALLRLAVYHGGGVPDSLDGRRQKFKGLAGAAIRMPEIIGSALTGTYRASMRLRVEEVADGNQQAGRRVLFDSGATAVSAASRAPNEFQEYATTYTIAMGDRTWSVIVTPLSDPLHENARWMLPHAVGIGALLLSLLVLWLLRERATTEQRAQSLNRSMKTIELQRARLADTQQTANIGAFEWDTREDKQTWSDHMYRLVGRPVGEPANPDRGFFISRIVVPEDIPKVRVAMSRVLADQGPVELECRIRRPDGTERIVATITRLSDAPDGARTHVVGTVRDVTDERRASDQEKSKLKFIQAMMDAIPTPVFQKDPAGRFQACNDAWCAFVGKSREEIVGGTKSGALPSENVDAILEQDRQLIARQGHSEIEMTMTNGAGESRALRLHRASYVDDHGVIAGLVGVAFDVTEEKANKAVLERTISQLDRRNRFAELLSDFGETLQMCMGLGDAYEAVAKYMPRLLPGSRGVFYRVDNGGRSAGTAATWGRPEGIDETLEPNDCVAIRRGQPRLVDDPSQALNCRHFSSTPNAYSCLPLITHGELIGMLHVQYPSVTHSHVDAIAGPYAHDGGHDLDTEWPATRGAAEQISLAIANLAMRENLREQATRDKLTGLYNRHYLSARFDQDLARARRAGSSVAVILIDIDHFKGFNDNFGHAAGDHVLREFAAMFRATTRESDVACRYGGEEFVLLMPDATLEVARRRAEQICKSVRAMRMEFESQSLGSISVSAGVAAFPANGTTAKEITEAADRALYSAKELGRDRVAIAALQSSNA